MGRRRIDEIRDSAGSMEIGTPEEGDIKAIVSMKDALAWSDHARTVFETCFQNGYAVTDFISEVEADERRNYFVLQAGLSKILDA